MGSKQAQGSGPLSLLRGLDMFPKVQEDFFQKTMSGGVITIAAYTVMVLLFISEFRLYLKPTPLHELSVDTSRGETIAIHFAVEFPRMPCAWLSLDAMDASGDAHLDVDHDVFKQRLSATGQPLDKGERHDVSSTIGSAKKAALNPDGTPVCSSCYGAETTERPCCETCDDVRAAYQQKGWVLSKLTEVDQCKHDTYMESLSQQQGEGCRIWGKLEVAKVAGNFHFAAGKSYQQGSVHIHDMSPFMDKDIDFSHTITRLSFGKPYPGMTNPLDGVVSEHRPTPVAAPVRGAGDTALPSMMPGNGKKLGMHQYFLKVVPTSYTDRANATIRTNQYSVTEHFRESGGPGSAPGRTMPGVFFFYDLSPIKVRIHQRPTSFLHFLTNVCAIVGGVFTMSGLLDGVVHTSSRIIRKKMELGKLM